MVELGTKPRPPAFSLARPSLSLSEKVWESSAQTDLVRHQSQSILSCSCTGAGTNPSLSNSSLCLKTNLTSIHMSALLLKGMVGKGSVFKSSFLCRRCSFSLNGMVKCVFLYKLSGLLGGTGLWQFSPPFWLCSILATLQWHLSDRCRSGHSCDSNTPFLVSLPMLPGDAASPPRHWPVAW